MIPLTKKKTPPTTPKSKKRQLYGVEYKHVRALRIVYLGVSFFLITAFFAIGYFVYNNVFLSLDQVNTLAVLKSEIPLKTINIPNLENIENIWEQRKQLPELLNISNPFDPSRATPTENITTTTTPATTAEANL